MEVSALCIRLSFILLFLLCAHPHKVDSDLTLRVEPNRQQFFEYEPLTFYCDGSSGSVSLKSQQKKDPCQTNASTVTGWSCTIKNLYSDDTGQYWCEDGKGRSLNSIFITVTNGPVILESPVHPVMEKETVTLRCRKKGAPSNLTADFYKDGRHISSSPTGEMTIRSVSIPDEGLYKCNISGGGESAESRLVVEGHRATSPETTSSSSTPWIIVTALLVVLLLGVVGHRHIDRCVWHRVLHLCPALKTGSRSTQHQTVGSFSSGSSPTSDADLTDLSSFQPGVTAVNASRAIYATVNKNRRRTDEEVSGQTYYILGSEIEPASASSSTAVSVHAMGTYALLQERDLYSKVQMVDP